MKSLFEIERKYLIKIPDFEFLRTLEGYTESEIEQIYLESESGVTARVRRRSFLGKTEFTYNEKRRVGTMTAIESEREISESEYYLFAEKIENGASPLYKKRYTFSHGEFTVEIDVYPFFKDYCVMEIELDSESTVPDIPRFIEVIKEVTGDKAYSNHSLAHLKLD